MFCANTRPVSVATTDFGEMLPVTVFTSVSGRSTAGWDGAVVVVVDEVAKWVDGGCVDAGAELLVGCELERFGCELEPRACTPNTIAAPTMVTTKNTKAARRCTTAILAGPV